MTRRAGSCSNIAYGCRQYDCRCCTHANFTTPRVSTASDTLTRETGTQARRAIRYVKCNGTTASAVKKPKLQVQMCLLAGPRASPHMQVARLQCNEQGASWHPLITLWILLCSGTIPSPHSACPKAPCDPRLRKGDSAYQRGYTICPSSCFVSPHTNVSWQPVGNKLCQCPKACMLCISQDLELA